MTGKVRVCFKVSKTTAMLTKLYKTEMGASDLEKMVDVFLHRNLSKILKDKGIDLTITDKKNQCPSCNDGSLVVRSGKIKDFLGCTKYPECKFTKSIK
ncbi:topoisomerase DNA-binding C4 zinc finger domain-containing protein [Vibrio vulnificus]|nr:topoisomerase DNA-binding C4 zinc finger domain-containing protein [Vibrio vulnificus]